MSAVLPPFGDAPLTIRNLRAPAALVNGLPHHAADSRSGLVTFDVTIRDGRFHAPTSSEREWDAQGRLALPGFVDMHVHLDKAFTSERTGFSDNGLAGAVELAMADSPNRTVEDIVERMDRALVRAEQHGTVALRTHLDTFEEPENSPAWIAFSEIESAWKHRLTLQAVALMALFRVENDDFDRRCAQIAKRGGVLGGFIGPGSATPERIDRLFLSAARHGLDLDLHVDETTDAAADGLSLVVETALRHKFAGRIVAGHCCALAQKHETEAQALIDGIAEAGIHVVALPLTNGFLQDRKPGRTPRLRGLAPITELRAAGVNVAFASDNVQDAFYPYGDFDMLDVMRQAQFLGQLEGDPTGWATACHAGAAAAMGLENAGMIRAGGPADAILFEATSWTDLFSRINTARTVLRNGEPLSATTAEAVGIERRRA